MKKTLNVLMTVLSIIGLIYSLYLGIFTNLVEAKMQILGWSLLSILFLSKFTKHPL